MFTKEQRRDLVITLQKVGIQTRQHSSTIDPEIKISKTNFSDLAAGDFVRIKCFSE